MIAKKEENIITIEFEEHRRIVAPALFQFNTGQVIKFNDVPDGAEVQFSIDNSEKTTNKVVKDSQVEIPDFLVAEGLEITAYIQYVNETSETTVKIISIPVEARVKQGEVVAPEDEQTFREELQGIMNETKEAAKEAADKVEINRKYLDEMEKKSTDTIENITTVGEAQINAINEVAGAKINAIEDISKGKLFDINGTAQAQINAINDVATKNIEAETNSIVQAAQGQIVGINQVASGQIDAINQKAVLQTHAINDTANRQIYALNQTATSQINAINQTAQAQSKALQEQGDGLKYDLAVKEKHTIMLSAGAYSDLIDVNEYDAIQVNSISCNGTDTISESLKLEVVKFKNGEQVGDEFLEKYNAIADLTDCDSIKLLVFYRGGISYVATVWYTLIVWDAKKEIERYVERVEDAVLIKPTVSGNDMVIDDSSNMPIQELHLFGRTEQKTTKGIQLLNLKDAKGGTGDGVTYTPNGDGSFKKTGTATGQAGNIWLKGDYSSDWENKTPIITLEVGKSYYIKDCTIFQGQTIIASGNGQVINVTGEKYPDGIKITGIRNTGFTLNKTYNEVIYPIIAESSTAVDWEEYTGGQPSPSPDYPQEIESVENPIIQIGGSNILNFENKESFEKNGIVCVVTDGIVKAKGTATQKTTIYLKGSYYIENGTYIFNPNPTKGTETYESYIDLTNQVNLGMSSISKKINKPITVDDNVSKYPFRLMICISKGATMDMEWKPQLLRNDKLLPYESYKEIQSAQQTCELNGIDDVRDELIVRADGTGQLVQRIYWGTIKEQKINLLSNDRVAIVLIKKYKALNKYYSKQTLCNLLVGTSQDLTINNDNLCCANGEMVYLKLKDKTNEDTQKWYQENKDNLKIAYPLEEPIVTDLSAEEVQKVLALRTYKPVTTVWNDQNADIEVTYVADAKSYIDKKFKELSDAIVASASETE